MRDVEIFLVDRQQMQLSSLTSSARHAVEGTLVGDTYRRRREHVVEEEAARSASTSRSSTAKTASAC